MPKIWVGPYRLDLADLSLSVTVRAEPDHPGLFGCVCSMVSSSLSFRRTSWLRHNTRCEVSSSVMM